MPPTTRKTKSTHQGKAEKRVRATALELIRRDRDLDDTKYTPPGAIGHYADGQRASRGGSAS